MLNFICGEVISIEDGLLVLKCGAAGYELFVSSATANACGGVGSNIQLFTHLQVREDGLTLFGFSDAREKQMFLRLVSISGIGCKMAMSILSNCDIRQLAFAILTGDTRALSAIKGVGKKTAERIILELKEKVTDDDVKAGTKPTQSESAETEALNVLMSLGLTRSDAFNRIKLAIGAGAATAEEILNFALKNKF